MQQDDNAFISFTSPSLSQQSKPNSRSSSVMEEYDLSADAKRRRLIASLNGQQMTMSSSFESPSNSPRYDNHNFGNIQSSTSSVYSTSTSSPSMTLSYSTPAIKQEQRLPTPSLTNLTLKDESSSSTATINKNISHGSSDIDLYQNRVRINEQFLQHQQNLDYTRGLQMQTRTHLIQQQQQQKQEHNGIMIAGGEEQEQNQEEQQQQLQQSQQLQRQQQTQMLSDYRLQYQNNPQLYLNHMTMLNNIQQQQKDSNNNINGKDSNDSNNSNTHYQQQYLQQKQQQQYMYQYLQQQQQQQQSHHHHRHHHHHHHRPVGIDKPSNGIKKEVNDETDEKEVIVIEDDEPPRPVCLGMFTTDVVVIKQVEFPKDEKYELVRVYSEGRRESGEYSFTVSNAATRRFYGWVPFDETKVLGPLADYKIIWWDAFIPHGKANSARIPLFVILYSQQSHVNQIAAYFKERRFYLRDSFTYRQNCLYTNVNPQVQSGSGSSSSSSDNTMFRNNYNYQYNSRSYSNQDINTKTISDIQKLLDSIPSDLAGLNGSKKKKKKMQHREMEDGRIILDSDDDMEEDDEEEEEEDSIYIEGLKVDLMPHQVQGVQWMIDRENNQSSSGGILADMGLGKTIQTIGLIISTMASDKKEQRGEDDKEENLDEQNKLEYQVNPENQVNLENQVYLEDQAKKEEKSDDDHKVTLIVTPLALIHQWNEEIKTKTDQGKLKVLVHHGSNRTRDPSVFAKYNVVITSYQIISSDFPTPETKRRPRNKRLEGAESGSGANTPDSDGTLTANNSAVASPNPMSGDNEGQVKNNKRKSDNPGALLQFKWYRVVLDEAQQIKNRHTNASLACSSLTAVKRWCLTGTPIQNNVEDLFSLIRFLRIDPLNDYKKFKETITTPIQMGKTALAMGRLKAVLLAVMLRRTKDVLKHAGDSEIEEKEEEEKKNKGKEKEYTEDNVSSEISLADQDEPMETSSSIAVDGEEKSSNTVLSKKIALQLPSREKTDILLSFNQQERVLYNLIEYKGKEAIKHSLHTSTKRQSSYLNMLCILMKLRQACDHPQLILNNVDKEKDLLESISSGNNISKMTIFACDLCGRPKSQQNVSFCNLCSSQIEHVGGVSTNGSYEAFKSSTKIEKLMEILTTTLENHPGEKTIVFSQFTSMLDLIEGPLRDKGIEFCRYDGSMSSQAREKSVTALRYNHKVTVMLISLKSGSLGLNLTAANRVILMDIWWNPAVENQAIDRVHRIGQRLPVYVTRLLIQGTIEQKINKLQEKKAAIFKGAMGDGMINNAKLTTKELHALFGM